MGVSLVKGRNLLHAMNRIVCIISLPLKVMLNRLTRNFMMMFAMMLLGMDILLTLNLLQIRIRIRYLLNALNLDTLL